MINTIPTLIASVESRRGLMANIRGHCCFFLIDPQVHQDEEAQVELTNFEPIAAPSSGHGLDVGGVQVEGTSVINIVVVFVQH